MDAAPLVAIRAVLYVSLMLAFGLTAFGLYAPSLVGRPTSLRAMVVLLVVALAASGLGLVAVAASMAGVAMLDVDGATLATIVTQTAFGWAWTARMGALVLALVLAVSERRDSSRTVASSIVTAVALGSLAWNGHAAAGEGATGWLLLVADTTHLLAAAIWIGALGGFALLLSSDRRSDPGFAAATHSALASFARIGTFAVLALVATGLVNGAMLVGLDRLPSLGSTLYGDVLIVKLAAFAAMLGLAASNRFRLTPALASPSVSLSDNAWRSIRRSVALEAAAGFAVLALVAWLGILAPPSAGG